MQTAVNPFHSTTYANHLWLAVVGLSPPPPSPSLSPSSLSHLSCSFSFFFSLSLSLSPSLIRLPVDTNDNNTKQKRYIVASLVLASLQLHSRLGKSPNKTPKLTRLFITRMHRLNLVR